MTRTRTAPHHETREIRVEDPRLSADTNERLSREVRETLGSDAVRVPAGRAHPSRGEEPGRPPVSRERPAATTVAALSEAGVRDPEGYFSALIDEFSPTVGPDAEEGNDRRVEAIDAPAQAGAEQRGAITPTSGPSVPAEGGGTPDAILWSTIAALTVVSVAIPAFSGGGAMWLLTAIMLPLLAAWVVLQAILGRRDDAPR